MKQPRYHTGNYQGEETRLNETSLRPSIGQGMFAVQRKLSSQQSKKTRFQEEASKRTSLEQRLEPVAQENDGIILPENIQ